MNRSKVSEFFTPGQERLHIIGCGSVGSILAENLVRCGCTKLTLYDFDSVEAKNIANQAFSHADIGRPKVEALRDILIGINPDAEKSIKIVSDGWHGQSLAGYVFLAVDSIETRREIVEKNMRNLNVKAFFDFRTGLTDAQHFAAKWRDRANRQRLLDTMQFSHEEAAAETPVSACGITLGVVTTVQAIVDIGVANYIKCVKGEPVANMVLLDLDRFEVDVGGYDQ